MTRSLRPHPLQRIQQPIGHQISDVILLYSFIRRLGVQIALHRLLLLEFEQLLIAVRDTALVGRGFTTEALGKV